MRTMGWHGSPPSSHSACSSGVSGMPSCVAQTTLLIQPALMPMSSQSWIVIAALVGWPGYVRAGVVVGAGRVLGCPPGLPGTRQAKGAATAWWLRLGAA